MHLGLMLIRQQCECTECLANTKLKNRIKPYYVNVRANEDGEWPDFENTQLMMCEPQVLGFLLTQRLGPVWLSIRSRLFQGVYAQ